MRQTFTFLLDRTSDRALYMNICDEAMRGRRSHLLHFRELRAEHLPGQDDAAADGSQGR